MFITAVAPLMVTVPTLVDGLNTLVGLKVSVPAVTVVAAVWVSVPETVQVPAPLLDRVISGEPLIPPLSNPSPAPVRVKADALAGVAVVMFPLKTKVWPGTVFSITPAPPVAPLTMLIARFDDPPRAPVNLRVPVGDVEF